MLTLKADIRNAKSGADKLRKAGQIPAVFYGKKEASTPIAVSSKDFMKIYEEAGESTVVSLVTPEGEKESLIHDIDFDPITGSPRHADFYVFEKGKKVEVELPIEFEGVSSAVKDKGGSLVKVLHELKIEAEPKNLPHHIIIDISVLNEIGDQVTAGELRLPEGVDLLENPEEVIVLVAAPKEEEPEEAPAMDLSEIEVEKKGKTDEESSDDASDAKGDEGEKSE